jgi:hypothetical protein
MYHPTEMNGDCQCIHQQKNAVNEEGKAQKKHAKQWHCSTSDEAPKCSEFPVSVAHKLAASNRTPHALNRNSKQQRKQKKKEKTEEKGRQKFACIKKSNPAPFFSSFTLFLNSLLSLLLFLVSALVCSRRDFSSSHFFSSPFLFVFFFGALHPFALMTHLSDFSYLDRLVVQAFLLVLILMRIWDHSGFEVFRKKNVRSLKFGITILALSSLFLIILSDAMATRIKYGEGFVDDPEKGIIQAPKDTYSEYNKRLLIPTDLFINLSFTFKSSAEFLLLAFWNFLGR